MAIAIDANLGNANAASLSTATAAATGSRIVMAAWWFEAGGTCTGASGGGLTWVVDHQYEMPADDHHLAILSAHAPSGLAGGTSITPSFSTAPDFGPSIAAASFTGVAGGSSGYLDTTSAGRDQNTAAWATNNLTTSNADDLIFAVMPCIPITTTHTPTHSEIHSAVAGIDGDWSTVYRIVAITGVFTVGGTWGAAPGAMSPNLGVAYKGASAEVPPDGVYRNVKLEGAPMRYG